MIIYKGKNAKVGNLLVNRLLPNKQVQAIGPFVFLDHFYPTLQKPALPESEKGKFAHPHRGVSTFTYVFSGEIEHFDSRGNHGIAGAGGVHWMKAGSGIHYDQGMTNSFQREGGLLHLLQFWMNLPVKNKSDEPGYLNLQNAEISELQLPGDAGKLRILLGNYGIKSSPIESLSEQFLYHLILSPKSTFSLHVKGNYEYAAFVPTDEVQINDSLIGKSELLIFNQDEGDIIFTNGNITEAHIIVFGGEPYRDAIVAEGPFVMSTQLQLCEAYKDFHLGKYGKIDYSVKANDSFR